MRLVFVYIRYLEQFLHISLRVGLNKNRVGGYLSVYRQQKTKKSEMQ